MPSRSLKNYVKSPFTLLVSAFMLVFLLAACGAGSTNTGAGGSPASPTGGQSNGTAYGCPTSIVNNNPKTADVIIEPSQTHSIVNAQVGNIIEVRLPFGSKWSGPTTSQGNLQLLNPAGFADQSVKACIWQFSAQSAGTVKLTFQKAALCKPGQMCAQYIMNLPFTIDVH